MIRGLKPGEVQVCAGFNDYRKAVTVTVIDPDVVGRYTVMAIIGPGTVWKQL